MRTGFVYDSSEIWRNCLGDFSTQYALKGNPATNSLSGAQK